MSRGSATCRVTAAGTGEATAADDGRPLVPLPLRAKPHSEECLPGFVARLAERNAREGWSVLPLLKAAGIAATTLGSIQTGNVPVSGLAEISGVDEAVLLGMSFPSIGGHLNRVGTGRLARRYLSTSGRRVCPACLAEDGVHRRLWHLSLAVLAPGDYDER